MLLWVLLALVSLSLSVCFCCFVVISLSWKQGVGKIKHKIQNDTKYKTLRAATPFYTTSSKSTAQHVLRRGGEAHSPLVRLPRLRLLQVSTAQPRKGGSALNIFGPRSQAPTKSSPKRIPPQALWRWGTHEPSPSHWAALLDDQLRHPAPPWSLELWCRQANACTQGQPKLPFVPPPLGPQANASTCFTRLN